MTDYTKLVEISSALRAAAAAGETADGLPQEMAALCRILSDQLMDWVEEQETAGTEQ